MVLIDSICNVYGNVSFIHNSAVICGGAVVLNNSDICVYGNALFMNNTATVSIPNANKFSSNFVGGGTLCCAGSKLHFEGYVLFQFNVAAIRPVYDTYNSLLAHGGAIIGGLLLSSIKIMLTVVEEVPLMEKTIQQLIVMDCNMVVHGGAIFIISSDILKNYGSFVCTKFCS